MRKITLFFLWLGLMGLAGCATTSEFAVHNEPNYRFLDSYKGYRLVERNNDIYLEKLDGSESRRITNTPNINERYATISKEGEYIAYEEDRGGYYNAQYYLIKFNSDDSIRKRISLEEIRRISIERERYKELY